MKTIGEKLKFFRSRSDISQLKLEVGAGLSTSTVSRIEGNQINATKETLEKLAIALKLTMQERLYLLDPVHFFVTDNEVEDLIAKVGPGLEKAALPCYILDNLRRVVYMNKNLEKLIGPTEQEKLLYMNKPVIELVFDPNGPIRKLLEPTSWYDNALARAVSYYQEIGFLFEIGELKDTFERLKSFAEFEEIWSKAKLIAKGIYHMQDRSFKIRYKGRILDMYFSVVPIEQDRRFEIIEFTPKNIVFKILAELFN